MVGTESGHLWDQQRPGDSRQRHLIGHRIRLVLDTVTEKPTVRLRRRLRLLLRSLELSDQYRVCGRDVNGMALICLVSDGTATILGSAAVTLNTDNTVEFVVSGNSLELFVNGSLYVNLTDTTLTGSGAVGLFSPDGGSQFSYFGVSGF